MHRHGANPEPHDTPLLAYGASGACLSWINKRQNQLPVSPSKVLERQPNTFSTFWTEAYVFNHGVIILPFCGISRADLTCILTERGDTLIFFFLTLSRGICWSFLSKLANLKTTNRHTKAVFFVVCVRMCRTPPAEVQTASSFGLFEDHYKIKHDRFVSLGSFQMLQTERTLVLSSNRNVCSFGPHVMGQKNRITFL